MTGEDKKLKEDFPPAFETAERFSSGFGQTVFGFRETRCGRERFSSGSAKQRRSRSLTISGSLALASVVRDGGGEKV
jgi:hypothetical protein